MVRDGRPHRDISSGRPSGLLRRPEVQTAIDDLGSGSAVPSYLREFAVDTLKIDRPFLHGPERDGSAAAMVCAVASLGRALGVSVTAGWKRSDARRRAPSVPVS